MPSTLPNDLPQSKESYVRKCLVGLSSSIDPSYALMLYHCEIPLEQAQASLKKLDAKLLRSARKATTTYQFRSCSGF